MSLPRMSFHVGDYQKHTGHLRAADHGAYLMLIFHYWATGGLPEHDDQLAAIARMSRAEWRKHRPIIKPLFTDDWRLPWLDAELADAQANHARRSKAGQKGNDVRWKKKRHFHADRHAFESGLQSDRNAIAPGSLPPASPHGKESQQSETSSFDGREIMNGSTIVPFPKGTE